jgi:hypothetical protein
LEVEFRLLVHVAAIGGRADCMDRMRTDASWAFAHRFQNRCHPRSRRLACFWAFLGWGCGDLRGEEEVRNGGVPPDGMSGGSRLARRSSGWNARGILLCQSHT